jgi:hypothetical protein
MGITVLLDGFIAILLVTTIIYAVILNRRLKFLRTGEAEMRAAIERFNASTAQAEANLVKYKEIATAPSAAGLHGSATAGRALAPLVEEARKLAADLNLLIGRGDSLIEQRPVAAQPRKVRTPGRVDMANPAATWPLDEELELIDALKDAR